VGSFARADDLFATRRNDIVLSNYKEPCCFAAGTKVSTPNGDRTIESLKVGDVVWSKPEKGGKPFAAKILATHQRSDQPIYRLKLKSVRADGKAQGETLLVTPGHPFYVTAKRDFISVIDLKPGDLLQSLADGDTDNTSSEVESLELYLPVGKTYNLTVDVGHTFYVGDLKTWVHNTGPCALPEGYFGANGASEAVASKGPTFALSTAYSAELPASANRDPISVGGKVVDGNADFGIGAKGPGQVTSDAISPPKLSSVEDLFGQTFESVPLSHLPNWKTGSLANDGVLGEQLSLQTLNEKTGLNFKPLQNSSNHGCDGCAVAINGDTITVVVMDAKSSVNGVSKAGTPHGDPRTRLEGWLGNRSIADSDPALRDALQAALDSGKTKVQGVTVKVGVPAPSKTGVAEFKVEPWTKK
jgi:hypothetical protein